MKNPYPKESGFQKRMNYAKRALIRYGDDSNYDIFTRAFDDCFENHDGEAVVFALMKAAKKERQKESKKPGGPDYFLLLVNKNSPMFTRVVMDAYRGGFIEPAQASGLLNTQINNFPKLEAFIHK